MTNTVEIVAMPEYAIAAEVSSQLQILLEECFPNVFRRRTYFKQLPHLRLLAMDEGSLVGQVGIDARVVNVGGMIVPVFGLIDLAVNRARRSRGIGTQLLTEAERLARAGRQEFLVLMADRHDLYLKEGYDLVQPALTKWLAIEDRQSVELITRELSDCFMVKPLAENGWPVGTIDMLGYLF